MSSAKPKVSFITTAGPGVASYRYRTWAPWFYLANNGVDAVQSNQAAKDADTVVFSKHWTYSDLNYAKFCRLRGQKVVFDICDDHFDSKHAGHYTRMCQAAEVVTCNSAQMRRILVNRDIPREKIHVIGDPVLTTQRPYEPGRNPELCWYGQGMNLGGLFEVYPEGCEVPLHIALPGKIQAPEHFNRPWVTFEPWQPDIIQALGERSSAALIPYRQQKAAKSANRVLEALNVGLPVITDLIPSVKDVSQNAVFDLRKGFMEGVAWARTDLTDEIAAAQEMINQKYSIEAIGKQWKEVLCG